MEPLVPTWTLDVFLCTDIHWIALLLNFFVVIHSRFHRPKIRWVVALSALSMSLWMNNTFFAFTVSLQTTSPQHKFRCSVQPLKPKCKILFSHTVFSSDCGELVPKTIFSKRLSISFSEGAIVVFSLFNRPSFFSSSCFAFNASLNLVNSGSMNSLCHICAL